LELPFIFLEQSFIRQGRYSHKGGIVVLVGYLGQLTKGRLLSVVSVSRIRSQLAPIIIVRNALSAIAHVEIDERDLKQLELTDEAGENIAPFTVGNIRRFTADQVVQVATIDTFQGCEAEIVILSTVRNQGQDDFATGGSNGSIGFLKASVHRL
jgi:hypothetical protein